MTQTQTRIPKHAAVAHALPLPWSTRTLAAATGQTPGAASVAMSDWLQKGWVRRIRKNEYAPTAKFPAPASPAPAKTGTSKYAATARTVPLPWTASSLAAKTGQSYIAATKSLLDWRANGWVRRIAPGKYEPTETFPAPATAADIIPAPGPVTPSGKLTADQRRELIKEIGTTYATGKHGKINFKVAFEEHPEWRAKLENSNYYSEALRLGFGKSIRPSRKQKAPEAEHAETPQVVIQEGVPFCPHCGNSLIMFNKTMSAMQQMALQPERTNGKRAHQ